VAVGSVWLESRAGGGLVFFLFGNTSEEGGRGHTARCHEYTDLPPTDRKQSQHSTLPKLP